MTFDRGLDSARLALKYGLGHFFDTAGRDVEMAIAAYALARLTEAHESMLITAVPELAAARRAGTRPERPASHAPCRPFSFVSQARPIEVPGDPRIALALRQRVEL